MIFIVFSSKSGSSSSSRIPKQKVPNSFFDPKSIPITNREGQD